MKQFLAALIFTPFVAFAGNGAGTMSFTMNPVEESDEGAVEQLVRVIEVSDDVVSLDFAIRSSKSVAVVPMILNFNDLVESGLKSSVWKSFQSGEWEVVR